MPEFQFDKVKMAELMLLISSRCQNNPSFGATALNKALYFADFEAYRRLGRPITGATYRRWTEGPIPKELLPAQHLLLEAGWARLEYKEVGPYTQKRLVPAVEPNEGAFDPDELDCVEWAVERIADQSAKALSDDTHLEAGWLLADHREPIPYKSAWLNIRLTDDERERAIAWVRDNRLDELDARPAAVPGEGVARVPARG